MEDMNTSADNTAINKVLPEHQEIDNNVYLPLKKRYKRWDYNQICRGKRSYVYRQASKGKTLGYEVFLIITETGTETKSQRKISIEHEMWPEKKDFGKTAWAYPIIKHAMRKFNQLEK